MQDEGGAATESSESKQLGPTAAVIEEAKRRSWITALRRSTIGDVEDRLVLLGAGASVEAGIPDGAGLDAVLRSDDSLALYRHVASTTTPAGGFPDVERAVRIIEAIAETDPADHLVTDLRRIGFRAHDELLSQDVAQRELGRIVWHLRHQLWLPQTGLEPTLAVLGAGWKPPTELNYLAPLIRAQKGGTIASLNYDNCVELAGIPSVQTSVYGHKHVRVPSEDPDHVRLLKLHGSLDWSRVGDDVISGSKPREALHYTPAIVFGAGNKLRHYGPYLELLQAFRERLSASRFVVVIGFGFRDPHITDALRLWASEPAEQEKHLLICLGPHATAVPAVVAPWQTFEHLRVEPLLQSASEAIKTVFAGYEFADL